MERISPEETYEFVKKYGVIHSVEDLKDERSIQIVNSYPSLISIPELFHQYLFVLNKLDLCRQSGGYKLGFDETLRKYNNLIFGEIKKGISNKISLIKENSEKKDSFNSLSRFNFILEFAKNNLGYSIINYELTKSEMVILPICISALKRTYKMDSCLMEGTYYDETLFLQKRTSLDFHEIMGDLTKHIWGSLIDSHSFIMEKTLDLLI